MARISFLRKTCLSFSIYYNISLLSYIGLENLFLILFRYVWTRPLRVCITMCWYPRCTESSPRPGWHGGHRLTCSTANLENSGMTTEEGREGILDWKLYWWYPKIYQPWNLIYFLKTLVLNLNFDCLVQN